MEDILTKLFQDSVAFGLLGFTISKMLTMLETLVNSVKAMVERLSETNAKLADAVKGFEAARLEEQRAHQEQTILAKMTLDKVAELENGR